MSDVLRLGEIDRTRIADVGGKAANLGELRRIDGIDVPDGFCVTTQAFGRVVAGAPPVADLLGQLTGVTPADREAIRVLSARIRREIRQIPLPADLVAAVGDSLAALGEHGAYAVRSSATAEDLPTASFAGQLDSYLDVVGVPAVLEHISRCWASLFTERAVSYRLHHGGADRPVAMAVVVQRMVAPDAAGVLFTADPVTSNRTVAVVEAVAGLGDALASGQVNADVYSVRGDAVVARPVGARLLTDAQVMRLTQLGRRIEAHFGHPQDVEWCSQDGEFRIVQSRPITTLFPVPTATDDGHHVYLSVGHQQMMTDAMRPLGLSVWQLTTPRPMAEAGGRLFVDVTRALASPAGRAALLDVTGRSDPLVRDALETVIDRAGSVSSRPDDPAAAPPAGGDPDPIATDPGVVTDPAIVTELIGQSRASLAALERDIRTLSGPALLEFIRADFAELRQVLFDPRGLQVITAAMDATWWLGDHLGAWLGEKDAADALTRSVPHNVTAEMGLALLDVADVIRPHPEVIAFLQQIEASRPTDAGFLAELAALPGGAAARDAIRAFLATYGMRCAGEIDITRPRWSERPAALVPTILTHVRTFEAGAGARRFEQGRQQAHATRERLLARLRELPDGGQKAAEVARMIDRVRTFTGYREYPKFGMISRYAVYRRALLAEAGRLVADGTLRERDDIFSLRLDELAEVVRTRRVDPDLVDRRRDEYRSYVALRPPRVLTSEGEAVNGVHRRDDLPPGALAGVPVSAGTVEGRARVVTDIAQADLEAGDILVTTSTDPSWTPLFVSVVGLVTEVGGVMTHGAVIAREYGLPAVVGVADATRLIRDGQRIRLHATAGYVELLP